MIDEMKRFFDCYPGTPTLDDYPKNSVHSDSTYRLDEAKRQASSSPVDVDAIVSYVNKFLKAIGMNEVEKPLMSHPEKVDYEKIKEDYKLKNKSDIVWMKFTEDGYLGVVAASDDINFDIPSSTSDYNSGKYKYNKFRQKREWTWDHNTSGILVHKLNKMWDKSFVLLFPLTNIPSGYARGDIERAIGNYLIANQVPILDFYSHNY